MTGIYKYCHNRCFEGAISSPRTPLRWGTAGRGLGSSYDRLCRDIDRLDEELLNTAVDPALLHRTVETSRRQNVRAGGGGPAAASASPR